MKSFAFIFITLVFISSNQANAEEDKDILGILAAAKMTGGCGIIHQMATFQDATKLEGGDNFINRFLLAEAARLGLTVDAYLKQCQQSIEFYDNMVKLSSE